MATRNEEVRQVAEGAAETTGSPTRARFPTPLLSRGTLSCEYATQRLVQRAAYALFIMLFLGHAMEMEHNSCLFLFFQEHVEVFRVFP
jgi:hypothetical protein